MVKSKLFMQTMAGLLLLAPVLANADKANGTLYYTTYAGGMNVHKLDYSYDGLSTFTMSGISDIAATNGADGIIFAPNGHLLIGGQGYDTVHEITVGGALINDYTTDAGGQFHLALDPTGKFVYGAGLPGNYTKHTLGTPGFTASMGITGDNSSITSLAFAAGKTFYTTSGGGGGAGDFGIIDLSTNITTQIFSNANGFHGLVFDPYTSDLIGFAGNTIVQVDPTTNTIVSTLIVDGESFDQGTTDGKGHILVASNGGNLTFLDYQSTMLVGGSSNFVSTQFLAGALDDVAPLAGLGSNGTPEPGSIALVAASIVSGLGFAARRRRK